MYYFCNQEKNIKNVNLDRERCKNVNLEALLQKDSPNSLFHKEKGFHIGLHLHNLIYLTFSRYNSQLRLPGLQNNFCGSPRTSLSFICPSDVLFP